MMLKEKLVKMLKKEEGDNKKKTENLIFFLVILIITVIAINIIWKDENGKQEKNDERKNLVSTYEDKIGDTSEYNTLEKKLEEILASINGVGNVKVLITYNETEELIPVYNSKDKTSITNETDSGGGIRTIEEKDASQEVIFENNKIVTKKSVSPKIEGAIITASGANNSNVKTNIIQAVEAATRSCNT